MCGSCIVRASQTYEQGYREFNMGNGNVRKYAETTKNSEQNIRYTGKDGKGDNRVKTPEEIREEVKEKAKGKVKDLNLFMANAFCESHFDQYAINWNTNGTYDAGIFQINSIHKIPNSCLFDIDCATEKAIEMWNINPNAWFCFKWELYKKYL